MNLTDEQLDRFEKAAEGQLSDTDQRTFETELAATPALRDEWRTYCHLRHSLEAIPMKQQLAALHGQLARTGQLDDTDVTPLRQHPGANRWVWWAAAALLALALGTWWWSSRLPRPDTQALFAANYRPESPIRGQDDCATTLAIPVAAYRQGQYRTALRQLDGQPTASPCTNYYRGLCSLALQRPDEAIDALRQAQQSSNGLLQQRAEWYLALAYLRADTPEQAIRQLDQIAQQSGHPFSFAARQLLQKLRSE